MPEISSQQAKSAEQAPSYEDLLATNETLADSLQSKDHDIKKLKARIAWFEKQVFGCKSERRVDGKRQPNHILNLSS